MIAVPYFMRTCCCAVAALLFHCRSACSTFDIAPIAGSLNMDTCYWRHIRVSVALIALRNFNRSHVCALRIVLRHFGQACICSETIVYRHRGHTRKRASSDDLLSFWTIARVPLDLHHCIRRLMIVLPRSKQSRVCEVTMFFFNCAGTIVVCCFRSSCDCADLIVFRWFRLLRNCAGVIISRRFGCLRECAACNYSLQSFRARHAITWKIWIPNYLLI